MEGEAPRVRRIAMSDFYRLQPPSLKMNTMLNAATTIISNKNKPLKFFHLDRIEQIAMRIGPVDA